MTSGIPCCTTSDNFTWFTALCSLVFYSAGQMTIITRCTNMNFPRQILSADNLLSQPPFNINELKFTGDWKGIDSALEQHNSEEMLWSGRPDLAHTHTPSAEASGQQGHMHAITNIVGTQSQNNGGYNRKKTAKFRRADSANICRPSNQYSRDCHKYRTVDNSTRDRLLSFVFDVASVKKFVYFPFDNANMCIKACQR